MSYNIPCGAAEWPLCRWSQHLRRSVGAPTPTDCRIFVFHVELYHSSLHNASAKATPLLTFPPFNAIVSPEISVDGEEPAMHRAERGPLGARAPRQAAAVPLRSRPGRPGRDRPLQRTRAAAPLAGAASRVEPWNTTSYPTPEHIRGGFFHSYPNYKEDYHERGKQSVYL